MTAELPPIDKAKHAAARRAVEFVEDGMRLGLGTGSTAAWMVRCLGALVRDTGIDVVGVATSRRTAELAGRVGVPVTTLDEVGRLDLTIDGTDECDRDLNLMKGGGGALLREKIVAAASDRMVVIADPSKRVDTLGSFPLPVETVPFGWRATKALIEERLADADGAGPFASLRLDGSEPFRTDEGNHVLDLHLRRIADPARVALVLNRIPGVVENGLFLGMCDTLVIGNPDGTVEIRDAGGDRSRAGPAPRDV